MLTFFFRFSYFLSLYNRNNQSQIVSLHLGTYVILNGVQVILTLWEVIDQRILFAALNALCLSGISHGIRQ